jgi:histone arginine demethylase JMJD6
MARLSNGRYAEIIVSHNLHNSLVMSGMITTRNIDPEQITAIDKRSNISKKELLKEYIEPEIPVIITDAAKNWPAIGKFTPDFFKTNYAGLTKEIKGKRYEMGEFINLMLNSTSENPAPYPFNLNIKSVFPELLADIKPEIVYGKLDRINHPLLPQFLLNGTEVYELFFGGKGAGFPFLHYDALYMHTQITQVYGAKEFIFYSPGQSHLLYPKVDRPKASQVDVLNPDYEKFPLFKQARQIRCVVEEGETLLFPSGWWHTTQIHGPSITMGRAQLNKSNWKNFSNDNYEQWKLLHPNYSYLGIAALMYTKALGKVMDIQEALKS